MSTFPQPQVTRYLQLINTRQFTEAQRQLQRIRQKIEKTEWNKGYYKALRGILLAQKNNGNPYTFLQNLNPNDRAALKQHRKEFQKHVQSRFSTDFDRGFFSAWTDYTRLLIRTIEETKPKTDREGQTSITGYTEATQKA